MTATIHILHPTIQRPAPDDTIRVDCEKLIFHLARDGRMPLNEIELLAEILEQVILRLDPRT